MIRARIGMSAGLVALLAVLTACSNSGENPPPPTVTTSAAAPSATLAPCAEACSDKEVTDTGCDERAVDAIRPEYRKFDAAVRGNLGLRKSNPAVCSNIYWVRYQPDPDSTGPFKVEITVGDKTRIQESEPGNPALEAWTVGLHAKKGERIRSCVRSGEVGLCLTDTNAG
jgi:hypothetical protein